MAETISMDVQGRVSRELLTRVYRQITLEYVKGLLSQNGMPTDEETVCNVATSYDRFPTSDLALRAFELPDGFKFWGIASGGGSRKERMAVKYLILQNVQAQLAESGISSEINIADLNRETISYMEARGMFRGRLPELRKIADRRGNLEDMMIGVVGAACTPV
ncbi:MAG: hypothetical protein KKB21_02640 [Nanoarchaeota archaeon]|nr:hypothetical protein [Nanoarchaeota archaeon]MBU4086453.1 hypothetical protein [Nanoarchaeota archaeon]